MYTAIPTGTVADGPLHPVRRTGILYCTDLKDSRQIRKDYSNAKRRLIIIGEDNGVLRPVNMPNHYADQEKMTAVSRHLAQDCKNEIWMVTDQDVEVFEKAYSHTNSLTLYEPENLVKKKSTPCPHPPAI
ncbi:hypothetical protein PCANC_17784 [Puccinia coronata f. sp. avenae]|uniref:Uncharacterized protein n=1 Tax=Puccinia coronata f. sp. avenae TaxID=200324 RepID=A0A2N5SJA7_9BASI|nr:hypothetical protein PCANC_17784 [Puccinia coronata f. sp. avenae]